MDYSENFSQPTSPRIEEDEDYDGEGDRFVNRHGDGGVENDNRQVNLEDRPKTPLRILFRFWRLFPIQVLMILVVVIDISFLIYEFATGVNTFESVTLFTSLSFLLELMVLWGYEGSSFFLFDRYWLYAEVVIIVLSFLVEYVAFILHHHESATQIAEPLRYLRAIRFLRVLIIWKTRLRHLQSALRSLVSADRRRYQAGGYDLDLTYLYPNLIATSWPSEGKEALYRNHIDSVAHFLDTKHPDSYEVHNLCSERRYDETKFHRKVCRWNLDDHNPGELGVMLSFAKHVTEFFAQNPKKHVSVVHCKGGKGRTGTMICAYLLYSGLQPDAASALQFFGRGRTAAAAKTFQGVESPSQERYVHYFERLLRMPQMTPPQRTIRINRLTVQYVPSAWFDVSKLWFCVISKPNTDRILQYVSNPLVSFDPHLPENPFDKKKKRARSTAPGGGINGDSRNRLSSPVLTQPASTKTFATGYSSPTMSEMSTVQTLQATVTVGEAMDPFEATASASGGGCKGFDANMVVHVNGSSDPILVSQFATNIRTQAAADPTVWKTTRLDVVYNTSGIPALSQDTHIKFFYNVDDPNPLLSPIQFWFHPSFEKDDLRLTKMLLDGPHKDKKHKRFSPQFAIEIGWETVGWEQAPTA